MELVLKGKDRQEEEEVVADAAVDVMRPCKHRRVRGRPDVVYFKPAGVPKRELEEVSLAMDEYEALRLKDFMGLSQEDACEKMGVSQPTFHRILASARKKVSECVVRGKALMINLGG